MKNALHTLLIGCLLFATTITSARAQQLDNKQCGRVENGGKIVVKGGVLSASGGYIQNKDGLMIIGDDTFVAQDSLLGRVEYVKNNPLALQKIPQIVYSRLYISGSSPKLLDTNSHKRNLVVLDTLNTTTESELKISQAYSVEARNRITHRGMVNRGECFGEVILNGSAAQLVDGNGTFKILTLNNIAGADVTNAGGFNIGCTLNLARGVFRNNAQNNFTMLDTSWIVRSDVASIETTPLYQRLYSVKYVGTQAITTGNEIPADSNALRGLVVYNTGGLDMNRNITVRDSIVVGTASTPITIRTDSDSNKYVLTLANATTNPVYENAKSEVIGQFRRSAIRSGVTPMVFNNRYTYVMFDNDDAMRGTREMTIDSRPLTAPNKPQGTEKVRRSLFVSALDGSFNPVVDSLNYRFGYGWCNVPGQAGDESNSLDATRLGLQHWDGSKWVSDEGSVIPAQQQNGWAYSYANNVSTLGQFAIGIPIPPQLRLAAKILLEGPYRNGSMAADLRERNLVPTRPPDIYPYNLDPNRAALSVERVPTDVIDWVTLELRTLASGGQKYYRTGFLRKDGRIVDLDGLTPIVLAQLDTGRYYVVVRHRNHLAVMSAEPYHFQYRQTLSLLDFSTPDVVMGNAQALKPVDCTPGGAIVYALVAGDINGDGKVDSADRTDYDAIWNNRDREDYVVFDTDMSGIVTTRDVNKSWNNRKRETNVP